MQTNFPSFCLFSWQQRKRKEELQHGRAGLAAKGRHGPRASAPAHGLCSLRTRESDSEPATHGAKKWGQGDMAQVSPWTLPGLDGACFSGFSQPPRLASNTKVSLLFSVCLCHRSVSWTGSSPPLYPHTLQLRRHGRSYRMCTAQFKAHHCTWWPKYQVPYG